MTESDPLAAYVVEAVLAEHEFARADDSLVSIPRDFGAPFRATRIADITATSTRLAWDCSGSELPTHDLLAVSTIISAIASAAPARRVYFRAVERRDDLVLDLARVGEVRGAIHVTASGWDRIDPRALGVLFGSTSATEPLPVPTREGSPDLLAELLGLSPNSANFRLLWGWLVCGLFTSMPRPLLEITGPRGAGKSTLARVLDSLGSAPSGHVVTSDTARDGFDDERITVELDHIPARARRTERALTHELRAHRAAILGALLDEAVGVLANRDRVNATGIELGPMADFHEHLAALDLHHDTNPQSADSYAATYAASVADDELTAAGPFVAAIANLAAHGWEGTATELRDALAPARPAGLGVPWPSGPSQTSSELARHAEALAELGVSVRRVTRDGGRRRLYLLDRDTIAELTP